MLTISVISGCFIPVKNPPEEILEEALLHTLEGEINETSNYRMYTLF